MSIYYFNIIKIFIIKINVKTIIILIIKFKKN